MLIQERHRRIMDILERENSVKVSTLTKLFNVSVETIRRDLEHMENQGLLKRVHGGAVLDKINGFQNPFIIREAKYTAEKMQIGEIVSRYIKENQSIAMDVSTTNYEIAKVLKTKFSRLTVLTNSLPIINELSNMEKYTLIIPGGVIRQEELSIVGDMAEENLNHYHVDTALISISGISLREGLTDYCFEEIRIKKKMMSMAQEIIIVADHSKFDTVSLVKVCDLDDIDMIITDSNLKDTVKEKYRKNGVEVISCIDDMEEKLNSMKN